MASFISWGNQFYTIIRAQLEPVPWYNLVMQTKLYTKDYTVLCSGYQLRLPLNVEGLIVE